ncbi:MAG: two-component regulator propeller domain-containing protein [Pyrinomonadaceae bacterium]
MQIFRSSKIFTALVICFSLTAVLTGFFAQNSVPSPTSSPSPSPTASVTPSPANSPTPTPTPPVAQNFHRWGSITLFNGLPSDSVRAIAQTADGVMWFGTDNGLARFDGRRVQNFSLGSPDANRITALKTAATGEMWIGTRAGAFVHADNRFTAVAGTENVGITAILLSSEIVLGTDSGNIFRVKRNSEGESFSVEKILAESFRADDGGTLGITSLAEFEGKLLAGTSGRGVFVVDNGIATEFQTSPPPLFVNSIVRGDNGELWFGTAAAKGVSGIFHVSGSHVERIAAPTADILALEVNDAGLWAGSERYGLFEISDVTKPKNHTFENTSGGLRSNTIYSIFTDREGVVWIGTNRGVSRYDPLGPFQENVSDIPNSNFIRTLFRASDGKIYAGSNRGVFLRDGDEWVQLSANGNQPSYAIAEDRSKKLLVGNEPIGARSFTAADGAVWTPAEHGVVRMRDGQAEKVMDAEDVRDIFVDGGDVWAATTTRGLLHARHLERFGWLVSSIGFEQGLPSEKTFAILPLDEGLLIATNRGVATYRPRTVVPKIIPVRVLSQRLHDLAKLRSTIELDYPQNSLVVEVAGQSSRTFPEEFQYAFVLTNSKGEMIESRVSNDAQYAPKDLSSGEYTIESIAFDRDLNASEPLLMRFSVAMAPFPWTATALGVLLVLAVAGLVWAVIEHRRITHRNRELDAARSDLANEAERERSRIARDLHDQTLADLRKLMMMSDKLPRNENVDFRAEIENVSGEIRRICEDLSPSVLENVGLVAALEFLLDNTIEKEKFSADEQLEEKINFAINVQLQIYRIAQEVLTNIASHSDATEVEMAVEINGDEQFALTITDDGTRFEPRPVGVRSYKGRGIANIRARASLINAQVAWNETERGGNRFSLTLEG